VIDNNYIHGAFLRLQLQAELFLQRAENGRTIGVELRLHARRSAPGRHLHHLTLGRESSAR
jgi:hypothetical protein